MRPFSWGPGRIDLFWVDDDSSLVHRVFQDGAWGTPESLGGTLISPPAATAWAADELQVFAIFPDGELWNRYWDGDDWHDWESLGGDLTGRPAASSWDADRIDVWDIGKDGGLWHRWWEGRTGSTGNVSAVTAPPAASRFGVPARSPRTASAATSRESTHLDTCSSRRARVAARSGPRRQSHAGGRVRSIRRTAD